MDPRVQKTVGMFLFLLGFAVGGWLALSPPVQAGGPTLEPSGDTVLMKRPSAAGKNLYATPYCLDSQRVWLIGDDAIATGQPCL